MLRISSIFLLIFAFGCHDGPADADAIPAVSQFSWMTAPGSDVTGITFSNDLVYTELLNPYTYRDFYNGGGVGIGDFDNDGRQDIFLTGNLVPNRLYRNLGDWHFEDRTDAAGVAATGSWSTGVAVADVNGDGWQDLYICKAGPPAGEEIPGMTGTRHNELFLNRGDGTFEESAARVGLDISGLSVHAAFFDYDGDGDLDCYLLNNSTRTTTGFDLEADLRNVPDPEGGNRLYRNLLTERGTLAFEDVSQEAGIYSSNIGFGLGVTVGDVNGDHLPDLFISNDYFERDYLYLNRGDGTFTEELTDHLSEISKGSMGADLADLDNDGLPELFVTEMLPASERRYKTKAAFDGWNRYRMYRDKGYHQQFSRNVLQYNRGNGYYSEVGRFSGVEATDWSWGALMADFDGDGLRDIFVANGTGRDLLDQDYINFNGNPDAVRRMIRDEGKGITDLIDLIPEEAISNGMFRNDGGLKFTDVAAEWGIDQPTFSNGSAYGDLDNDGDLDLVVNNVDAVAGIYRNNSAHPGRMVRLVGTTPGNPDAIGATVREREAGTYTELQPMRGFQSTVDKGIHLPASAQSAEVRWPDGQREVFQLSDTAVVITLRQGTGTEAVPDGAEASSGESAGPKKLMRFTSREASSGGATVDHRESRTTDFDRDPLIFIGINNEGPALAAGDVDGDGLTDLYLGGGAGQPGRILRAQRDGSYRDQAVGLLSADADSENVGAAFFDADGDGDPDLYVANGSNEFGAASTALLDKLYLNEGGGRWSRSDQLLPVKNKLVASACVAPRDVDGDGDVDLFVGGRLRPGLYGVPTDSYLLINDGEGNFSPSGTGGLQELGMITAAVWAQLDEDPEPELVVAGEWTPLRYLHFDPAGRLTETETIPETEGLWHSLAVADFDGDGRVDVAAGNHGLNSRLRAYPGRPLELHVNDFDGNGRAEQILTRYAGGDEAYPLLLRDDLVKQLPSLRKRVARYADYQGKTLEQLFDPGSLERSVVNRATELRSLVVLNRTDGHEIVALPPDAQLAPVHALCAADLNGDGITDLLAAGNQSVGRPETGIYAASFGAVLIGNGDGTFTSLPPQRTGLYLTGDVRGIRSTAPGRFAVARSGQPLLILETAFK